MTATTTTATDPVADAAARFAADTPAHAMTVLHDDGLYRHLRFQKPGTGMRWFDLVTWPGRLTIDGGMGTYTFARVEDMFTFFRHRSGWNSGTINPGYWGEKIRAGGDGASGRAQVKQYSEESLREQVAEAIRDYAEEWPGLAAAVQAEILDDPDGMLMWESEARAAVRRFEHTVPVVGDDGRPVKDPLTGRQAVREWRFTDVWEWELHDFTFHYLWCCHAIQWGISQYDTARKAAREATP